MNSFRFSMFAAAVLAAVPSQACTVCGCSLSSDWAAQGYAMSPGFETGFRFEYFDQHDLRVGTASVDRAAFTFPNDTEIQQRTINRILWVDLNEVINPTWAFAVSLPRYDRFHTTIAEGDSTVSTSRANGIGDLQLLLRHQKILAGARIAWQVGLKIPTGGFDQTFAGGPRAGELLDRGLQLGTGTTDLLAGVSWFGRPAPAVGCFVQLTADQPLAERENFLPSGSVGFSSGIRWLNSSRFTPQLQLNVKIDGREHGSAADTANSGATIADLSPGLTATLGERCSAFAFLQLPVFQRVNGFQLEPRYVLSSGVRWRW